MNLNTSYFPTMWPGQMNTTKQLWILSVSSGLTDMTNLQVSRLIHWIRYFPVYSCTPCSMAAGHQAPEQTKDVCALPLRAQIACFFLLPVFFSSSLATAFLLPSKLKIWEQFGQDMKKRSLSIILKLFFFLLKHLQGNIRTNRSLSSEWCNNMDSCDTMSSKGYSLHQRQTNPYGTQPFPFYAFVKSLLTPILQ